MAGVLILSFSLLLHLYLLLFFILFLRYIKKYILYWISLVIAVTLMTVNRVIPLVLFLSNSQSYHFNWQQEIIQIVIPVLIFVFSLRVRTFLRERNNAERNLEQTHQKLNDIIEFLPDATFVIDTDRRVIAWNLAMEKMSGTGKKDMLGKSTYSLSFYDEMRPILIDIVLEPLEESIARYPNIEFRGNRVYGEAFTPKIWGNRGAYCWGVASKLFDTEGNVIGAIESIRDITEKKQAEEAMIKLNTVLEEKVQKIVSELRDKDQMMMMQSRQAAMGEMLKNIAHHWRQPLNTIGVLIQNLLIKKKESRLETEDLEQSVDKVMKQIRNMSRTIDEFGEFFRQETVKAEFSLVSAAENALNLVKAILKNNGIEANLDFTDHLTVTGYPHEFSQVVLNILNNALEEFRAHPPENPKITLRIFTEGQKKVVTVSNNAGLIPEKLLSRIFEPFFTTKEMGVGIGLYMSKTIIEKNMGGKLKVRNLKDGPEFRIEF